MLFHERFLFILINIHRHNICFYQLLTYLPLRLVVAPMLAFSALSRYLPVSLAPSPFQSPGATRYSSHPMSSTALAGYTIFLHHSFEIHDTSQGIVLSLAWTYFLSGAEFHNDFLASGLDIFNSWTDDEPAEAKQGAGISTPL